MHYPLHLGVTEAGDGEDGRIKGAIGIGSLLIDGLGDTIRVSLTEDSVYEIPVAQGDRGQGDEPLAAGGARSRKRRRTRSIPTTLSGAWPRPSRSAAPPVGPE
jgi:(E)-4-hydroxy-3-methylbut-2-enyl-diphosphate synthase